MQSLVKEAQEKIADVVVWGSAGGNMVRVAVNGKFELVEIKLDPICVDNRDVPMLEDLIKAAHHDAIGKLQEKMKSELGPMVSNLASAGISL